jgi:hypothetical protein
MFCRVDIQLGGNVSGRFSGGDKATEGNQEQKGAIGRRETGEGGGKKFGKEEGWRISFSSKKEEVWSCSLLP